jgi:phosphoenolpyruvate synthase/pyruvate phosphate dikinase
LLARDSQIELEIVAPGVDEIVTRLGEDVVSKAKSVKTYDMTFQDYIKVMSQQMPRMMKKAAEDSAEVRKWVEMIYVMREASLHRER